MRRFLLSSAALLAFVACAESNTESSVSNDDGGAALPPSPDASPDAPAADDAGDAGDAGDAEAGTRVCSDDGFCHSTLPAGQSFRGVWGDGQGIVWGVTAENAIVRWDGAAWSVFAQLEATPSAVWGSGPTDVWIGTTAGLLHGTGATSADLVFAPVADLPGDNTLPIKSIWGTGPNDIWAVGGVLSSNYPFNTRGRALHYDGTAWTLDSQLSSQGVDFSAVVGVAGSGLFAAGRFNAARTGQSASLFQRAEGASTWTSIFLPADPAGGFKPYAGAIEGIGMSSAASIWLAGKTAGGAKASWRGTSSDNGATFTWSFVTRQTWERPIYAFWGTTENDTWAVGAVGLVSHWNGSEWEQAAIRVTDDPLGKALWSVWGTSSSDFWVVGDGVALHKTPAGKP